MASDQRLLHRLCMVRLVKQDREQPMHFAGLHMLMYQAHAGVNAHCGHTAMGKVQQLHDLQVHVPS